MVLFVWVGLEGYLGNDQMVKTITPTAKPVSNLFVQQTHWLDYKWRMRGQQLPPGIAEQLSVAEDTVEAMTIAAEIVANILTYSEDIDSYGRNEYIASFSEAMDSGLGDCDEYAAMWYFMLREVGFDAAVLSVSLWRDPAQGHAVTAVRVDSKVYILDMNHVQHGRFKPVELSIWQSVWSADIHYASSGLATSFFKSWMA